MSRPHEYNQCSKRVCLTIQVAHLPEQPQQTFQYQAVPYDAGSPAPNVLAPMICKLVGSASSTVSRNTAITINSLHQKLRVINRNGQFQEHLDQSCVACKIWRCGGNPQRSSVTDSTSFCAECQAGWTSRLRGANVNGAGTLVPVKRSWKVFLVGFDSQSSRAVRSSSPVGKWLMKVDNTVGNELANTTWFSQLSSSTPRVLLPDANHPELGWLSIRVDEFTLQIGNSSVKEPGRGHIEICGRWITHRAP